MIEFDVWDKLDSFVDLIVFPKFHGLHVVNSGLINLGYVYLSGDGEGEGGGFFSERSTLSYARGFGERD